MKAIRVHATGGPEVLQWEEMPDPSPAAGQVRVRIEAAGLNFIDIYFRTGLYKVPSFPYTPGLEGAGTIDALGPQVTGFQIGDRIAFTDVSGAYAEKVIAPTDRLIKIPSNVTTRDAAALMLQGMTAHYLTHSTYALSARDTCLVHAAAGGVGQLLVQVAKLRGARVLATVSTPEKAERVRSLGADDVFIYDQCDFADEARKRTEGRGVDVIYDGVGRATFEMGLTCLRPRGLMVLFGQASGAVPPFDLGLLSQRGSLFVTRPTLFHYIATRAELIQRSSDILSWKTEGRLEVQRDYEFPLAEARRAHEALASRRTTGKVLLVP